MPELPEVETTRRGLAPLLRNQRVHSAIVRNHAMRLPVPRGLPQLLAGATIRGIARRGKYLLFDCARADGNTGTLILHLGMSGRLWVVDQATPAEKHDHFDLVLENGMVVRLRDPRRFGLVLWHKGDPLDHKLLAGIGPEPFSPEFSGAWLYRITRHRGAAIKLVIMDSHVVAGVGNIYANEALFRSGINPLSQARRISNARCTLLAQHIRETLGDAIVAGGSSLRDYVGSDGMAGNFQSRFSVYDRAGEPCPRCGTQIRHVQQGQRATYYCPSCQKR
jgi:formamidopyrimidine-DNA glycosylase